MYWFQTWQQQFVGDTNFTKCGLKPAVVTQPCQHEAPPEQVGGDARQQFWLEVSKHGATWLFSRDGA